LVFIGLQYLNIVLQGQNKLDHLRTCLGFLSSQRQGNILPASLAAVLFSNTLSDSGHWISRYLVISYSFSRLVNCPYAMVITNVSREIRRTNTSPRLPCSTQNDQMNEKDATRASQMK